MNMPPALRVVQYWANDPRCLYLIDTEEPCCFACHRIVDDWNKLQRAHVVAASLGGSDDVSNLVMLCRECHVSAPDTVYPDRFHQWCNSREKCPFGPMFKWSEHESCMKAFGLTIEQSLAGIHDLQPTDARLTSHFGEGVSMSSIYALIAQDLT